MSNIPIAFEWTGDEMTPLRGRQTDLANARYIVGKRYALVEWEERSLASHHHQFAWLHDAWMNLPDEISVKFSTPEHLRKHALIMTKWCDVTEFPCNSESEADRVMAVVQHYDNYCMVTRHETLVTVYTARSQKMRGEGAMTKAEFQQSKSDILEYVAALLQVEPKTLLENGGMAA